MVFLTDKCSVRAWIISGLAHALILMLPLNNSALHRTVTHGAEDPAAVRGTSTVTARLSGDTSAIHATDPGLSSKSHDQTEARAALAESSSGSGLMGVPFGPVPVLAPETRESLRFYPRAQLSSPPVVAFWPDMESAIVAGQEAGASGVYRFRLYVSEDGEVVRVQVVSGEGALNEGLVAALSRARFLPARLNGDIVGSQVEVVLEIEGSAQGASQVSEGGARLLPLSG